jgi:hypothetical protein
LQSKTWERAEGGHWQRHCASSPRSSLDLGENDLVEGGGRAVAETLRLSTTLTLINLHENDLGEGGGRARWQRHCS